jgi:hypothetical protein
MSDEKKNADKPAQTLNGQPVTSEQLDEKKKDQTVRIVEKGGEGTGDFRELKKLRG